MIESALRYILINDATVSAITTRCYPVMLPQYPVYPLILYTKISGDRDHHLQGPSGHAHPRFQVEAWSESYTGAKTLADAIRKALDGYSGTAAGTKIWSALIDSERDTFESVISVYRVISDWFVWHEE
ncbi:MAG: DUF3168 domain-containing protein [Spirochaetales bacterium]|jgi:hypothetical protein|nr:DUF3168 domain-containing protein [Spirochaetales bacterium]